MIIEVAKKGLPKQKRSELFTALKESIEEKFNDDEDEEKNVLVSKYFSSTQKNAIRDLVLDKGIRLDGRKSDQIRDIWCEVDYLPSTHGSSIFTRGETQALATVTLGTSREANMIDLLQLHISPQNHHPDLLYLFQGTASQAN